MSEIYLNSSRVGRVETGSSLGGGVSEAELEKTVGVSLLADFNQQLADISEAMQTQLNEKKELREELASLETLNGRTEVTDSNGEEAVEISAEEKTELEQMGYTDLNFVAKSDGSYTVTKDSLGSAIENGQEELAGLNATSELTMLQIQSLVDQRKNAITLLSNLIASKNETLTGIIRNLKN